MSINNRKQTQFLGRDDLLRGEVVYLRPPRFEEIAFIRSLWADPATMAAVGGTHELSESKARSWFERMVDPGDSANCYCLIYNQQHSPVGEISFHRWNADDRSAELNIKIMKSCRR